MSSKKRKADETQSKESKAFEAFFKKNPKPSKNEAEPQPGAHLPPNLQPPQSPPGVQNSLPMPMEDEEGPFIEVGAQPLDNQLPNLALIAPPQLPPPASSSNSHPSRDLPGKLQKEQLEKERKLWVEEIKIDGKTKLKCKWCTQVHKDKMPSGRGSSWIREGCATTKTCKFHTLKIYPNCF